ncbi:hypothetical protein MES5069_710009 [Mesorhizobium escarrei]|uniref:Transposase DDE domain-containing protein n=1 Tax=Mesorhizobium escarrei TaxID=666018 RepID=A0ABN8KJ66_9HYPH|nr:hypothetical protein MES5069_710009 [Mesorhizobium escarrei]
MRSFEIPQLCVALNFRWVVAQVIVALVRMTGLARRRVDYRLASIEDPAIAQMIVMRLSFRELPG